MTSSRHFCCFKILINVSVVSDTMLRRRPIYFYIGSKSFSLFKKKKKNIDKLVYAPIPLFSFLHFCYCFLCLYVFYSLTWIHLFMLEFSCTERSLDCYIFFFICSSLSSYFYKNKCINSDVLGRC